VTAGIAGGVALTAGVAAAGEAPLSGEAAGVERLSSSGIYPTFVFAVSSARIAPYTTGAVESEIAFKFVQIR